MLLDNLLLCYNKVKEVIKLNLKDDEGHKLTDGILSSLEDNLIDVYNSCYDDTLKKIRQLENIIEKYDDSMTLAEKEKLWKEKDTLNNLLDSLSKDIQEVNKTAVNMINGELLNVYDTNYRYGNYFMEQESGYVLDFRLYNQGALKSLLMDYETTFSKIAINTLEDKRRLRKALRKEFAQAIRLGESIEEIAERVKKVVGKNRNDSIRIARTETTRVESLGREDSFKQGEKMGLKLKKVWISTADKRTRDSHLILNGKAVDMESKFDNGLKFPGDQVGRPEEVINCRCTHVVEIQGVKKYANLEELEEELKDLTFKEWERRRL